LQGAKEKRNVVDSSHEDMSYANRTVIYHPDGMGFSRKLRDGVLADSAIVVAGSGTSWRHWSPTRRETIVD